MQRRSVLDRTARRLRIALLLALFAAAGCTWESWTPKERPGRPPESAPSTLWRIELDERREATLDCAKRECNQWYRVDVPRAGALDIVVEPHVERRPVMRLLVRPLGRPVLGQTMGEIDGPLELRGVQVGKGPHLVLVQGGGGRLPYALTITLKLGASPGKPE